MSSPADAIDVLYTPMKHDIDNLWNDFGHEKVILPKGWIKDAGRRPLSIDMIYEKDIPVMLRDGTVIYVDVFRPVGSDIESVPAILPWSIFGKSGSGKLSLDVFPWRLGIPRHATSGLEKWEAPDPAEWVPRGYAIVNSDARGIHHSEGNMAVYGTQEGRDGYDTIEWIGTQTWCNGSVGMAGNSWLGTTQWFIGAERPPHLKALAPWEGLGDYYRETLCRGGIPDYSFWSLLLNQFQAGPNSREHIEAMIEKHPTWNSYWEDKKPRLHNINVPIYALASYSTGLHTVGSFRGFLLSSSAEKWLRIHHTQEWHDIYQPENNNELQRFFDRYLKGHTNGWETTPKMRLSLLGYNQPSVIARPIDSYPPPEFSYRSLYLNNTSSTLQHQIPSEKHASSYDATLSWSYISKSHLGFTHKFDQYTELAGFSKAVLYMSTPDHDDMDVFVVVRKLDAEGQPLQHFNIPFKDLPAGITEADIAHENVWRYVGPNGRLRASHRATARETGYSDEKLALLSDAYVFHPHDKLEKVQPNQIVKMEIMIWPGGMVFHAGESMRLDVQGHHPVMPEFEGLDRQMRNFNVGRHFLHTGGEYPSSFYVSLSR